jgi:excisionase family DNA binding protein
MAEDDLVSAAEAAAILGMSDETLRRWAEAGRIRYVRLPSGQIRFFRRDIAAILDPVEPGAEPA